MLKLYKVVDGELKLVDLGVPTHGAKYAEQGYVVEYPIKLREKNNG